MKPSTPQRILSLLLAAELYLPMPALGAEREPAHALRQQPPTEAHPTTLTGLEENLTSSAGVEEERVSIEEAARRILSNPDGATRVWFADLAVRFSFFDAKNWPTKDEIRQVLSQMMKASGDTDAVFISLRNVLGQPTLWVRTASAPISLLAYHQPLADRINADGLFHVSLSRDGSIFLLSFPENRHSFFDAKHVYLLHYDSHAGLFFVHTRTGEIGQFDLKGNLLHSLVPGGIFQAPEARARIPYEDRVLLIDTLLKTGGVAKIEFTDLLSKDPWKIIHKYMNFMDVTLPGTATLHLKNGGTVLIHVTRGALSIDRVGPAAGLEEWSWAKWSAPRNFEDETVRRVLEFAREINPELQEALARQRKWEYPRCCHTAATWGGLLISDRFRGEVNVLVQNGELVGPGWAEGGLWGKARGNHHVWLLLEVRGKPYYLGFADGQFGWLEDPDRALSYRRNLAVALRSLEDNREPRQDWPMFESSFLRPYREGGFDQPILLPWEEAKPHLTDLGSTHTIAQDLATNARAVGHGLRNVGPSLLTLAFSALSKLTYGPQGQNHLETVLSGWFDENAARATRAVQERVAAGRAAEIGPAFRAIFRADTRSEQQTLLEQFIQASDRDTAAAGMEESPSKPGGEQGWLWGPWLRVPTIRDLLKATHRLPALGGTSFPLLIEQKPTLEEVERLLSSRTREYFVAAFRVDQTPYLIVTIGKEGAVSNIVRLPISSSVLQTRKKVTPIVGIHNHNSGFAFPSRADFFSSSLQPERLSFRDFVYGSRSGLFVEFGVERRDRAGPAHGVESPQLVQLQIWRAGTEQPVAKQFPRDRLWKLSDMSGDAPKIFQGALRRRGVTRVQMEDADGHWVRWNQEVTLASLLNDVGVLAPAAGLEEAWQTRLMEAARRWQEAGWILSAERFVAPFAKAGRSAARRTPGEAEQEPETWRNRRETLDLFSLLAQDLSDSSSPRSWRLEQGPELHLLRRVQRVRLTSTRPDGERVAELAFRTQPDIPRIDIGFSRRDENGAVQKIGNLRLGADTQLRPQTPPVHPIPVLHLDLSDPEPGRPWMGHGSLNTAFNLGGDRSAKLEAFLTFQWRLLGRIQSLPPAAPAGTDAAGLEEARWELDDELQITIPYAPSAAIPIAFDPDGKRLAYGDERGVVSIEPLDVPGAGTEMERWKSHDKAVTRVSFTPKGRYLLTLGKDLRVVLMDLKGTMGENLAQPLNKLQITAAAFSASGSDLILATANGEVGILPITTPMKLDRFTPTFKTLQKPTDLLAVSPDGNLLATCEGKNHLTLWDIGTGLPLQTASTMTPVQDLAFSPDSRRLAFGTRAGSLFAWDVSKPAQYVSPVEIEADSSGFVSVAFSPDSRLLAGAARGGLVYLWRTDSRAGETQWLEHPDGNARAVAFSPDGKSLAVSSTSGTIHFWKRGQSSGQKPERDLADDLNQLLSQPSSPENADVFKASPFIGLALLQRPGGEQVVRLLDRSDRPGSGGGWQQRALSPGEIRRLASERSLPLPLSQFKLGSPADSIPSPQELRKTSVPLGDRVVELELWPPSVLRVGTSGSAGWREWVVPAPPELSANDAGSWMTARAAGERSLELFVLGSDPWKRNASLLRGTVHLSGPGERGAPTVQWEKGPPVRLEGGQFRGLAFIPGVGPVTYDAAAERLLALTSSAGLEEPPLRGEEYLDGLPRGLADLIKTRVVPALRNPWDLGAILEFQQDKVAQRLRRYAKVSPVPVSDPPALSPSDWNYSAMAGWRNRMLQWVHAHVLLPRGVALEWASRLDGRYDVLAIPARWYELFEFPGEKIPVPFIYTDAELSPGPQVYGIATAGHLYLRIHASRWALKAARSEEWSHLSDMHEFGHWLQYSTPDDLLKIFRLHPDSLLIRRIQAEGANQRDDKLVGMILEIRAFLRNIALLKGIERTIALGDARVSANPDVMDPDDPRAMAAQWIRETFQPSYEARRDRWRAQGWWGKSFPGHEIRPRGRRIYPIGESVDRALARLAKQAQLTEQAGLEEEPAQPSHDVPPREPISLARIFASGRTTHREKDLDGLITLLEEQMPSRVEVRRLFPLGPSHPLAKIDISEGDDDLREQLLPLLKEALRAQPEDLLYDLILYPPGSPGGRPTGTITAYEPGTGPSAEPEDLAGLEERPFPPPQQYRRESSPVSTLPEWRDLRYASFLNRHSPQWSWLRQHALPSIVERVERSGRKVVNIVIPGASTGEELARAFHEVATWLEENGRQVARNPSDPDRWQIRIRGTEVNPVVAAEGQARLRGERPFDWYNEKVYRGIHVPGEKYVRDVVGTLNRYLPASRANLSLTEGSLEDLLSPNQPDSETDLVLINLVVEYADPADRPSLLAGADFTWPGAWLAMTSWEESDGPGHPPHYYYHEFTADSPHETLWGTYFYLFGRPTSSGLEEKEQPAPYKNLKAPFDEAVRTLREYDRRHQIDILAIYLDRDQEDPTAAYYRSKSNPPPGYDFADFFLNRLHDLLGKEEAERRTYYLFIEPDHDGVPDNLYAEVLVNPPTAGPSAAPTAGMEEETVSLDDLPGLLAKRLEALADAHPDKPFVTLIVHRLGGRSAHVQFTTQDRIPESWPQEIRSALLKAGVAGEPSAPWVLDYDAPFPISPPGREDPSTTDPEKLGIALPVVLYPAKPIGEPVFSGEGLDLDQLRSALDTHLPWGVDYYDGSSERRNYKGSVSKTPLTRPWDGFSLLYSRFIQVSERTRFDVDIVLGHPYAPAGRTYATVVGRPPGPPAAPSSAGMEELRRESPKQYLRRHPDHAEKLPAGTTQLWARPIDPGISIYYSPTLQQEVRDLIRAQRHKFPPRLQISPAEVPHNLEDMEAPGVIVWDTAQPGKPPSNTKVPVVEHQKGEGLKFDLSHLIATALAGREDAAGVQVLKSWIALEKGRAVLILAIQV